MSSRNSSARSSVAGKPLKRAATLKQKDQKDAFDHESLKDDEEYKELLKLSIPELRLEKQKAIKELNFVRSGKIGAAIQTLSQGGDEGFYEKCEKALDSHVSALFAEYDKALEDAKNEMESKELKAREDTHSSFLKYKEEHLEKVKSLEIERQVQIHLANTRRVAEAVRLENKARTLASMDQPQEAIETLQLSRDTEANERARMIEEINNKYDKLIYKYLQTAKSDLDALQNRLNDAIHNYQELNHHKEVEYRKKYTAMVRGAPQRILNQMYNQEMKNQQEKKAADAAQKSRSGPRPATTKPKDQSEPETDPNKVKRQLNDLYKKLIAFVENKINSECRGPMFTEPQSNTQQ